MQTRRHSAIEATTNVVVGYALALATQMVMFPLFNLHVPLSDNLAIGAVFTVISLLRSYVLRRLFNRAKGRSDV